MSSCPRQVHNVFYHNELIKIFERCEDAESYCTEKRLAETDEDTKARWYVEAWPVERRSYVRVGGT